MMTSWRPFFEASLRQVVDMNWQHLEIAAEKAMATHSSVLAWRIPGMGEPGGLPSMGSHTVGHTEVGHDSSSRNSREGFSRGQNGPAEFRKSL